MRKRLNEAVGVPQGIIDASKKLYTYVINQIGTKGFDEPINENSNKTFKFKTDIEIIKFKIVNVVMSVQFVTHNVPEVMLIQAGFNTKTKTDYSKFIFVSNNKVGLSEFKLVFVVPKNNDTTTDDILNYIGKNEEQLSSTLAHELKHAFDDYVKGFETIIDRVDYNSTTSFHGFGLPSIRNFFHNLYLGTNAEILVKPTEVASRMDFNKVGQKEFLEFLLNDNTYKEFKEMSEMTFKDFILNDLLNDKDEIIDLFQRSNIDIPNSESELFDKLFRFLYVEYVNNKIEVLNDILTENMAESFFGFNSPEKIKFFNKNVNQFAKYENNPKEFFKERIKYLNFIGNKMIKKLGKLYSIAKEGSEESNIIKKIYNKVNHGKR